MRNRHRHEQCDLLIFPRMYSAQLVDIEAGLFHAAHQLSRRDAVHSRKPNDGSERRTLQAPLKRTQDSSVNPEFDENVHLGSPAASRISRSTFPKALSGPDLG